MLARRDIESPLGHTLAEKAGVLHETIAKLAGAGENL